MAARYIFQLRRGMRYVDDNGETLLKPDGTPVHDDWTEYTAQEGHLNPLEGELVLEYEYNPSTGKTIPRLKIGDGENTFAHLPYMSVDSFILPTSASITLEPDQWDPVLDENGEEIPYRYYQPVTVNNAIVTPNSKVDLQPTPEQLAIFAQKDLTFTAVNRGGNVRVCIVGQKPTQSYTLNATVTEVV